MAIDTSVPRTRRALLAGGIGGLAALVASALGRPLPVSATDGQIIHVGDELTATSVTKITLTTAGQAAIAGKSGSGFGVLGQSTSGHGVYGDSDNGWGVSGASQTGTGVRAVSDGTGVGLRAQSMYSDAIVAGGGRMGIYAQGGPGAPAIVGRARGGGTGVFGCGEDVASPWASAPADTGVYGRATLGRDSRGVYGYSSIGTGVYGRATGGIESRGVHGYSTTGDGVRGEATTGNGVHAMATTGSALVGSASKGYALRTWGRLRLDKASGVATIVATASAVTVTPSLDVTADSFVLLTPRGSLGGRDLWYTTNASANTFTIKVSKAVDADLKVGWLLLG